MECQRRSRWQHHWWESALQWYENWSIFITWVPRFLYKVIKRGWKGYTQGYVDNKSHTTFLITEKMQIKTIKIYHYTPIKHFFLMIKNWFWRGFQSHFSKARDKRTMNPSNLPEVQFGNMQKKQSHCPYILTQLLNLGEHASRKSSQKGKRILLNSRQPEAWEVLCRPWDFILPLFHRRSQRTWGSWVRDKGLYSSGQRL